MSILTKVFLVLVAVLSIALSTLTIAANSLSHSWKKSAEDWKAAAMAASAAERSTAVQAKLTHEQDLDKLRRMSAELEKSKSEGLEVRQDLEAKSLELAQAQSQNSGLTSNVTGLRETLGMVSSQFAREQEFSRKIAARNAELERRNIDLSDRTKELTTALAMATTQVRALQQQLAAVEEGRGGAAVGAAPGSGGLQAGPAAGSGAVVEAFQPSPDTSAIASVTAPIRGTVTGIRGNICGISVGSADGVSPGMRFLIHRSGGGASGSQYVGTLQIARVEANESAGTLIRSSGDIRNGDQATDEASFAMRR
ncbi:MAG: hypothetical protein U1A27_10960 [Phycisphaerae bacterium]